MKGVHAVYEDGACQQVKRKKERKKKSLLKLFNIAQITEQQLLNKLAKQATAEIQVSLH